MGKTNNYSVYWIHHPCLSNKFTDGYIGITKNIKSRWAGHKHEKNNCVRLRNAINKYGDILVWEILHTNIDMELAELIEYMLRPVPAIGWNLRSGGSIPKWSRESIEKSANSRKKKFEFTHPLYGDRYCSVTCITKEFSNVAQSNLNKVVTGKYKSSQGWRLKITDISETNDGFKYYTWFHNDYGIRHCTIKELSKEFEFKSFSKLYDVAKGNRKTCNGWKIQIGET